MANKTDLTVKVAERTGFTKKDVDTLITAFLDSVVEEVAQGNEVSFVGFGKFISTERGERKGRNPQTGDEIIIPKRVVPAFKAGKQFKDKVSGK